MKKLLGVVLSLCLAFGVGTAFADQDNDQAIGFGSIGMKAKTFDAAGAVDFQSIPNGGAFGLSGGIGHGHATAGGFIINGLVEGEVEANSAGFAGPSSDQAYRWSPGFGDKSIGVGSSSTAIGNTGASAKIKVDPDKGFGEVDANIHGFAAQGTLNGSALTGSPRFGWDSGGFTAGLAGQGSIGSFEGNAFAISGPDFSYRKYLFCGPRIHVDSKAGAGMGAEINMNGGSWSDSYRFIDWDKQDGTKTEGMGTYVGAYTNVTSHGYDYDWDKGLGYANANVEGGYTVIGGAATLTVQTTDTGFAKAGAFGVYSGSGSLGSNYSGSAIGGSHTQITTIKGMNGSASSSSANMTVISTSGNQPQ